ncbi:peptide/nickel transport system permease protein [Pseudorhodobacter antarcticus]|uniref:Peptide/nickel transport system permease protein n=1 Tax=Pseudorhodobacter antarcticus TaxID=1077947 RepID=A0A1H8K9L2_9RHOB|nr:ABC transporter permease [Pseudorhodobacter antarcticus]SEN89702.1 peptide/nickel transport system permease protein [Pseudorhodobacter antarcticus]
MKRFLSVKGLIGLILVGSMVLIGIFAPILIPPEAGTAMDMTSRLSPPSWAHPFGTDQLGRDLMVRVLLGTRLSLEIAVTAVMMSILIGLPLGMVSGYFGGITDNVLMRLVDTLLAFPALLLALTISAILGPNLQNTIIAIGVAFTPFLARIVRGEALRVAQMPYVEAARASGTTDMMILWRHILPNILPAVIVQATISIAFAILAEAGLSFLGLGTQPPAASWGLMIQASRDFLDRAPWTALVPGIAVALTVLGLNMFGDVLRDILDPRSK